VTSQKSRVGSAFNGAELGRVVCSLLVLGALFYVISSLFISAFLEPWQQNSFPMLGSFRMFPPFADLRWVTALSECGHDLAAIAAGKDPGCDPYQRPGGLAYPAFSVYSAMALGLGLRHTGIVAFGVGLTLVLLLVAQMRCLVRPAWIRDLLLTLLLLGFPLQLGLERANIDIIIFVIIEALCGFLALSRRWALPFVGLLSFLPVAFKVYPVVGLLTWVFRDWLGWRHVRSEALVVLVGASLGMLSALPWLWHYGGQSPDPGEGVMAHGFITSTLFYTSNLLSHQWAFWPEPFSLVVLVSIKLVAFTVAFLAAFNHGLSDLWIIFLASSCQGYMRKFFEIYITLMTSTWLGCYLLSSSFDYRLIFSFPGLIACVAMVVSPLTVGKSLGFLFKVFVFVLPLLFLPSLLREQQGAKSLFLPLPFVDALVLIADYFALPIIAGVLLALIFPSQLGGATVRSGDSCSWPVAALQHPLKSMGLVGEYLGLQRRSP